MQIKIIKKEHYKKPSKKDNDNFFIVVSHTKIQEHSIPPLKPAINPNTILTRPKYIA